MVRRGEVASRARGQLYRVGSVVKLAEGKHHLRTQFPTGQPGFSRLTFLVPLDFAGLEPGREAGLEVKPRPLGGSCLGQT